MLGNAIGAASLALLAAMASIPLTARAGSEQYVAREGREATVVLQSDSGAPVLPGFLGQTQLQTLSYAVQYTDVHELAFVNWDDASERLTGYSESSSSSSFLATVLETVTWAFDGSLWAVQGAVADGTEVSTFMTVRTPTIERFGGGGPPYSYGNNGDRYVSWGRDEAGNYRYLVCEGGVCGDYVYIPDAAISDFFAWKDYWLSYGDGGAPPPPFPEPRTWLLLASGLFGMGAWQVRRGRLAEALAVPAAGT